MGGSPGGIRQSPGLRVPLVPFEDTAMSEQHRLALDPEVKPPEYRVPRGRSGVGAESALSTLLADLERIRRAKEAYGDLPIRTLPQRLVF